MANILFVYIIHYRNFKVVEGVNYEHSESVSDNVSEGEDEAEL